MPREVRAVINSDGTATLDWSGFQGPACLDAAKQLRERLAALGIQVEETNFQAKPELEAALENQIGQRQAGQEKS